MEENPLKSPLKESDVRAIVELLSQAIAAPGGIDVKRRLLLEGLCRLVGAAGWVWGMAETEPGRPAEFVDLAHQGGDPASWQRCLERMNQEARSVSIPSPILICRPDQGASAEGLSGGGLADDGLVPEDQAVRLLIALQPKGEGGLSGMGILGHASGSGFGLREIRLCRVMLTGIPWLYSRAFSDRQEQWIDTLYPRHRTVLELLCKGWSRKRISEHIGVSINTVHGYVKAVFKQLGVHSQAELVSRFKLYDHDDEGTIRGSSRRRST